MFSKFTYAQRMLIAGVIASAPAVGAASVPSSIGCTSPRVISAWQVLDAWPRHDIVALVSCTDSEALSLVHAPVRREAAGALTARFIPPAPLAIMVPFACDLTKLDGFLRALAKVVAAYPLYATCALRLIVSVAPCPDGDAAGFHDALAAVVDASFPASAQPERSFEVALVSSPGAFSRASARQSALAAHRPGEIAVLLDVDMRVTPLYFQHALALGSGGASYFPIVFSGFNPAVVRAYAAFVNVTNPPWAAGILRALVGTEIRSDVGYWRPYGYGMLATRADELAATRGFNVSYSMWGMEDTHMYDSVVASAGSGGRQRQ